MSKQDTAYRQRLIAAIQRAEWIDPDVSRAGREATRWVKALRAGAYAALPGRQNRKHVAPLLDTLVRAACRTIRRSK